jgi:hypothetical protein
MVGASPSAGERLAARFPPDPFPVRPRRRLLNDRDPRNGRRSLLAQAAKGRSSGSLGSRAKAASANLSSVTVVSGRSRQSRPATGRPPAHGCAAAGKGLVRSREASGRGYDRHRSGLPCSRVGLQRRGFAQKREPCCSAAGRSGSAARAGGRPITSGGGPSLLGIAGGVIGSRPWLLVRCHRRHIGAYIDAFRHRCVRVERERLWTRATEPRNGRRRESRVIQSSPLQIAVAVRNSDGAVR